MKIEQLKINSFISTNFSFNKTKNKSINKQLIDLKGTFFFNQKPKLSLLFGRVKRAEKLKV